MPKDPTQKKAAIQMALPLQFAASGNWFVPTKRIKIDDRNYLLQMGKPVQIGSSYDVAKATGIGRRILKRLAKQMALSVKLSRHRSFPCTTLWT